MKKLSILAFALLFVACKYEGKPSTDAMPPAPMPGEEVVIEKNDDDMMEVPEISDDSDMVAPELSMKKTSGGSEITLENFGDRSMLNNPISISGTAPRNWFFEGNFPIVIMTLEEEVVKEWYAEGAWLDPLEEGGDINGTDMIPFTITTDYEAPAEGDMGKIRFSKNMVGDDVQEDVVEVMVLWP